MATPYINLSYIQINLTSTKQIKHQKAKQKKNRNMPQNYQSESSVIRSYKTWFKLISKVLSGFAVFKFDI